jgi:hypothetical protein
MKNKKIPIRSCVGCREKKEKSELIRIVRTPDKEVKIDPDGKAPGRGAYICKKEECFRKAIKSKNLSRALDMDLSDDVIVELSNQVLNHE